MHLLFIVGDEVGAPEPAERGGVVPNTQLASAWWDNMAIFEEVEENARDAGEELEVVY